MRLARLSRLAVLVTAPALATLAAGCSKPKAVDPPADAAPTDAAASPSAAATSAPPQKLTTFASDEELKTYLADYGAAERKRQEAMAQKRASRRAASRPQGGAPGQGSPPPSPAAPAAMSDSVAQATTPAAEAKAASATGKGGAESVTNNQTAGVDEGGIVKVHGDHLVILRRGRLFTVRVDGKNLTPVAAVDAFGPGVDPRGTWYDEMLISGNTAVVIGYSYARGGTEVGVFDLDSAGGVAFRATYHLRGNDYYSARNYASRVIGQKLVFYTPSYLRPQGGDVFATFPAVRKWHPGATPADFHRVVEATRVYRPALDLGPQALHTVTSCDLSTRELACTATSVLGPSGRVFYVSASAVYVWMTGHTYDYDEATDRDTHRQTSAVVRLPLDGGAPGAVKVAGGPIDQFSFLEDEGHLNVFVRAETHAGGSEAMWGGEATSGDAAMLRLPLGLFSEGATEASPRHLTRLPRPKGYALQNRFVGRHVLYGAQSSYGGYYGGPAADRDTRVYAYPYATGKASSDATAVDVGHSVDRLEALGSDAVVVGQRERDLHFTSLALRDTPKVASVYVRKGASQGEQRSHGFFYKPDSDTSGLLGLPVLGASAGGDHGGNGDEGAAKVLFLKNQALDLSPVGELASRPAGPADDGCRASCVDWYGNARPLFLRGRIFGLMGYELVEGALDGGRIHEVRRVSFAPKTRGRPAEE